MEASGDVVRKASVGVVWKHQVMWSGGHHGIVQGY